MTLPLIPFLIFIGIIIGIFIGIFIGRRSIAAQNVGEAKVAHAVNLLLPKPYYLFNNITLETDRGTTQIDHVLITPSGIFVVETKDYSNWIYGSPDQRKWTQVHFKKKTQFLNPLDQNAGHVKALKKLFNLPDNHFHDLIVFTGSAEFKTDLGPNVIQLSQLSTCLTQPRPVIFDETKMTYIVGRIEMNRLPRSRETDEYHINYVRSKLN